VVSTQAQQFWNLLMSALKQIPEMACLLVHFDHAANVIVNADHGIM